METNPERFVGTIRRAELATVKMADVIPEGADWPYATTEQIRQRFSSLPLEEVLAACVLESARGFYDADGPTSGRVVRSGPLQGFRISICGLAYVARQALIACTPTGVIPERVSDHTVDCVRRAAIDAHRHIAFDVRASNGLTDSDAVQLLLSLAGWQAPFFPIEMIKRLPRYLSIFEQPIQAHHGMGATLSAAFEEIHGLSYPEFVAIGFAILTLILPDDRLSPIFTIEALRPLWTDPDWPARYTEAKVRRFLALTSRALADQQVYARKSFDVGTAAPDIPTAFSPFVKFPFVQLDDTFYLAPIPQYIFLRVTEGAVWDLADYYRDEQRSANRALAALGDAFEEYVGGLLRDHFSAASVYFAGHDLLADSSVHGPDFIVVRNRTVLLLEAKGVHPTVPIKEGGQINELEKFIKRNVINPLRQLPKKQSLLYQDDTWIARLPRRPKPLHCIVTLGSFPFQRAWWQSFVTPLLSMPRGSDGGVSGDPYDGTTEHHLISCSELENATVQGASHFELFSFLRQAGKRGNGTELQEVTSLPRSKILRHSFADSRWESWKRDYLRASLTVDDEDADVLRR